MNTMKKWFYLLLVTCIFIACEPENNKTELEVTIPEELPSDLEELRSLLSSAKQAEKKIENFTKELESKIDKLDTSVIKRVSVTAIHTQKDDFKSYAEIQSSVQADASIMASSETGGRLIDMKWEEGQTIRKGDIVGRVDLEAIDKQKAELEKRLELATTAYQRQKRLWDQNIGSEMQYLQAKNNMESLQKTIETIDFQKTKQYVYSPASGVIDRVLVKQGEMAGPGSPILMIMNTNQVKVVAGVPEKYLKNVKKGDWVTVKFPSLEEEKKARVSLIGRTVHPSNRTFEVEVTLSNPGGILKPNLLAMMMINDEIVKDAILVPEELIRKDVIGNAYVFVVEKAEDGDLAKRVMITTGSSFEGNVIVEDGLKGDELIIEKGGRELSDGQAIDVAISKEEEQKNNG